MGQNQGYIKYTQGYARNLTASEVSRGYLFISKDKKINAIPDLSINIKGITFTKKIDSSGRIFVGKPLLSKIGSNKIKYTLVGNVIKIDF